jgi:hypothetical protein
VSAELLADIFSELDFETVSSDTERDKRIADRLTALSRFEPPVD